MTRPYSLLRPIAAAWFVCLLISAWPASLHAQAKQVKQTKQAKEPEATPVRLIKAAKGFKVERLFSVPKDLFGSWVNMCVGPKGQLIVSDQYGRLHEVTMSPDLSKLNIMPIEVDIGEAQGLLWAFDSLYVVVNRGKKYASGLYRVRDTNGDDFLDKVETLRKLDGGAEHGPHAVLLTPDGKGLYIVCGNNTQLTDFDTSRVPRVWDEDQLLPRTYGRGFMKGVPAPGGWIARVDPDGKQWELVATGFRNQFDAALNADGELFAFDADMEWDLNTPWYRPTRVCHTVSGAEFGWRNGAGKFPSYYPDSVPASVDIGPGSPTGVCFGYGAKFPAKYQKAYFACDWSYGKLYAVHLEPDGASYRGKFEEFITGTPLPLTDIVVNPHDGAMYFTIGGRRVQSGLYRVTYVGNESTAPVDATNRQGAELRALRHKLEALHVGDHADAVKTAWPYLKHEDRLIRFAARIAIEHRPVAEWRDQALAERDPQAAPLALLALARTTTRADKPQDRKKNAEIDTPAPQYPAPGKRDPLQAKIVSALGQLKWEPLNPQQRVNLLRAYAVAFARMGPPDEATRKQLVTRFDAATPDQAREVNFDLAQMLVYLQAPTAARKVVALLNDSPTQEQQIHFAKTLRHLREGWTPELQASYFKWFVKASGFRGGASFLLFVQHIKSDAMEKLSNADKERLKPILEAKPPGQVNPQTAEPRPFVKAWTFDELVPLVEKGLSGRNYERGRKMFSAANCFGCHRFDNQGGAIGPDLTGLSGRFSPRDIFESVIEPSKVISDQYEAVQIVTASGKVIIGRIVNLHGDSMSINTNMLDPNAQEKVSVADIEEMNPSKVSMMPKDLLNTLEQDEILDLMAYLLSRGDPNHAVFRGGE